MGRSTADTPTTPEFLRVSDADRDHAVDELRDEFVQGRLSHETFVYRMQTALDARNRGQLANLFTDLHPLPRRRTRLLARIKAVLRDGDRGSRHTPGYRSPPIPAESRGHAAQSGGSGPVDRSNGAGGSGPVNRSNGAGGSGPVNRSNGAGGSGPVNGSAGLRAPSPLFFPPGRGDRFTNGRTRDCDLCLTDLSVSRLHAELVRGAAGWLLNDLGSHNGTRLNGWLVRETVPVRVGDRLEFGSMSFVVQDDPQEPAGTG